LLGIERYGVFAVGMEVPEFFHPAKGKKAMGAATPTLIPTMPTSIRDEYSRADLPLLVNIDVALPKGERFTN